MKLIVNRKQFLALLDQAASVADRKATAPILSNTLLTVDGNSVTVSASDLFTSVQSTMQCSSSGEHAVCVNAKAFADRIRLMPGDKVKIEVKSDVMSISSPGANRKFSLATIPGDEFPKLPVADDGACATIIPYSDLAALIEATIRCVSTDTSRLALNSMLFEIRESTASAISTDGHRLAISRISRAEGSSALSDFLVPQRGVTLLKKLLADASSSEVSLTVSGPNLFVGSDESTLSIKLCDAQFPPYDQVIPKSHTGSVVTNRDALISSTKAVAVATSARTGGVSLTISGDGILIEGSDPDTGTSADEIGCQEHTGAGLVFGVNWKYLVDALESAKSETVRLEYSTNVDPMVLSGGGITQVVMPMRI